MLQKFLIFSALVAVSSAVILPGPAYHGALPVAKYALPAVAKVAVPEPYDPNPQYSFSYDVHDATTGDVKSQQETRNGDAVQGAYSLIEPDGSRRIVEYTADPVHGFNAVVRREPGAVKVAAVAKVISPIAKVLAPAPLYHAPVLSKALLPAAPLGLLGHAPLGLLGHAPLGLPAYH